MWEELQRAILRWGGFTPLTSTEADPDNFEKTRQFKLPLSYRDFVKRFGRCKLTGDDSYGYFLAAPGVGDQTWNELDHFNEEMTDVIQDDYDVENPEVGARLVFFAYDNDAQYGWDPAEVTNSETHEYAIWIRYDGYRRVASSFEQFIKQNWLCETLDAWRRWVASGGEAMIDSENCDGNEDRRIVLTPM